MQNTETGMWGRGVGTKVEKKNPKHARVGRGKNCAVVFVGSAWRTTTQASRSVDVVAM